MTQPDKKQKKFKIEFGYKLLPERRNIRKIIDNKLLKSNLKK